jgi:hypothetical protein
MHFPLHRFFKIALLNLLVVATIGVVLRYKIAFSLPFIDQRHLLDAHSHFAFTGWITHAIMILMVAYLAAQKDETIYKKYRWIINANLLTAYGMLISFIVQGYGLYSILFSILSIFVSYVFAFTYWKDLNSLPSKKISDWWLKAALVFNTLSSAGALALAYMMATRSINQNWYLAAIYFFLHFQYNGWFLFACMGLITNKVLSKASTFILKKIFWLFAFACGPAYLLSALWLPIPGWVYVIIVIAAFSQLAGWILMVQQIIQQVSFIKQILNPTAQWILFLSSIALSIKLLLQLGSTIPSLSKIAFGFRPIVIGYLHLILLGVITLFLLGFMIAENYIRLHATTIAGIKIFTAGIIINEMLLMMQGIAAMSYTPIPYINEMLFATACILFTGIGLLNIGQQKT